MKKYWYIIDESCCCSMWLLLYNSFSLLCGNHSCLGRCLSVLLQSVAVLVKYKFTYENYIAHERIVISLVLKVKMNLITKRIFSSSNCCDTLKVLISRNIDLNW